MHIKPKNTLQAAQILNGMNIPYVPATGPYPEHVCVCVRARALK